VDVSVSVINGMVWQSQRGYLDLPNGSDLGERHAVEALTAASKTSRRCFAVERRASSSHVNAEVEVPSAASVS